MSFVQPLAAVLPVFNEETRIKNTLMYYASFLRCPLYIIDAGSSDHTISLCVDLADKYSAGLSVLNRKNSGTTETQEWVDWLLVKMPHEFYIFLSCSEALPLQCLELYEKSIDLGYDLVYVNRKSFFLGSDISQVYSRPKDIAMGRHSYFPICRFASRRALLSIPTFIHDNWLSSAGLVNTHFSYDEACFICHYKNSDLTANLIKHISYAKIDAEINMNFRTSFLRIVREIIYILFFLITFRLNRSLLIELLMRVGYHLNVLIFMVLGWNSRSKSRQVSRYLSG